MIAVVDYASGNLRSVAEALRRAGAEFEVTSDAARLLRADRVILPGVGEAAAAMAKLRDRGLDAVIPNLTCPVLGICIGMQLLCLSSEEGEVGCLGVFPVRVRRLQPEGIRMKVPHVGWNTITGIRSPLFGGTSDGTFVYYVHSYAADLCPATVASTDYGGLFSAALARNNFYGTQFHPEKSGASGACILENFLRIGI